MRPLLGNEHSTDKGGLFYLARLECYIRTHELRRDQLSLHPECLATGQLDQGFL
jgi:hypothetical protein